MIIRQLSEGIVNRIAAGEVVERPASVVKELVENAIDAGATRVDILTDGGGRRLIRISDDGSGMRRDDLELSVERHATSKLNDDDLLDIRTFGFRGEALPSIGAVARLTLTTRHKDEPHGWSLSVEAGHKSAAQPAAITQGTRVEVQDLFYATPARLKFLKSERSEALAITDIVKRLAMAHPTVGFVLAGEGQAPRNWAPQPYGAAGLLQRIADVMGRDFEPNAMVVDAERDGVHVHGFAGLPTYHKATSAFQYLFVNGRPVRDKLVMGAVRGAYSDVMSRDRHPAVALFVSLDPHEVDVNVHPAKTEVRFRDSGLVRGLIVGGIRQAIAQEAARASTTGGDATLSVLQRTMQPAPDYRHHAPPRQNWDWRSSPAAPQGFGEMAQAAFAMDVVSANIQAHHVPVAEDSLDRPLGAARAQIHETYIVAQTRTGMVIVDQHAAHERLVYEKLKAQKAQGIIPSQTLLVPVIVELEPEDCQRLTDKAAFFETLGLSLEAFGPGAVAVRAMPQALHKADCEQLMRDLAEHLAERDDPSLLERKILDRLATFACHHSVRAGRRLSAEEMNALLREMEATPAAGQCNHGRPTYVELKLSAIERLFGRSG